MPINQSSSKLQSQAMADVFNERKRQIEKEGYTTTKDDLYVSNELVRAGAGYVNHVVGRSWIYKKVMPEVYQNEEVPDFWPWADNFWKPKSPREDLVRAAALIIAEIERIDRIEIVPSHSIESSISQAISNCCLSNISKNESQSDLSIKQESRDKFLDIYRNSIHYKALLEANENHSEEFFLSYCHDSDDFIDPNVSDAYGVFKAYQLKVYDLNTQLSLQRDRNKALEAELTNSRNHGDVLQSRVDAGIAIAGKMAKCTTSVSIFAYDLYQALKGSLINGSK